MSNDSSTSCLYTVPQSCTDFGKAKYWGQVLKTSSNVRSSKAEFANIWRPNRAQKYRRSKDVERECVDFTPFWSFYYVVDFQHKLKHLSRVRRIEQTQRHINI
jgi:hypothetical protein